MHSPRNGSRTPPTRMRTTIPKSPIGGRRPTAPSRDLGLVQTNRWETILLASGGIAGFQKAVCHFALGGMLILPRYFRKVVADSEERIPRYKKTISVCSCPMFTGAPPREFRGYETTTDVQELRRAVDSLGNTNDIPSAQGTSSSLPTSLPLPLTLTQPVEPTALIPAIAHTIQNHQNAIYTLAASVEGLEVRWNDVRDYYS